MGAVPVKILAVYDEPGVCSAIRSRLSAHGLDCRTTSDPRLVEELLASQQFDVLIVDIAMPGLNGLELLVYAKQHSPGCQVILITGGSNRELLAQALMLGAYEYLEKPLSLDDLMAAVSRAAQRTLANLGPLILATDPEDKKAVCQIVRDLTRILGSLRPGSGVAARLLRAAANTLRAVCEDDVSYPRPLAMRSSAATVVVAAEAYILSADSV